MARTRPWIRLDAAFDRDGKVRRARAVAIWPLVLCRLKPGNGRCSTDDLDPELLAGDAYLEPQQAADMLAGLVRVGLLEVDGDEYRAPGWGRYQEVDARPHSRARKPPVKPIPNLSHGVPDVPSVPQSIAGSGGEEGRDGSGRDTGADATEGGVESENGADSTFGALGAPDATARNRPAQPIPTVSQFVPDVPDVPFVPQNPVCPNDRTGQDRTGQTPVGVTRTRTRGAEVVTDNPPPAVEVLNILAGALIVSGRRSHRQWTANEERTVCELVEAHGLDRCVEVARDIDAAERPVAMLKKRLGTSAAHVPPSKPPGEMTPEEYQAFCQARRRAQR